MGEDDEMRRVMKEHSGMLYTCSILTRGGYTGSYGLRWVYSTQLK